MTFERNLYCYWLERQRLSWQGDCKYIRVSFVLPELLLVTAQYIILSHALIYRAYRLLTTYHYGYATIAVHSTTVAEVAFDIRCLPG
jgi:hypothetical protein